MVNPTSATKKAKIMAFDRVLLFSVFMLPSLVVVDCVSKALNTPGRTEKSGCVLGLKETLGIT
ncbi:hypothetical protein Verru16b_00661 [Lacunisphaera limnophila]|uniref:Uncharacterized protein n=2 Tax=Lacunisphaera limnophila TaxID=1838286 RepID=A0A1D8ARX0_9BACT|nr:hypothetical protein Verru16b_00661 [Lacunisphaera limnophila]